MRRRLAAPSTLLALCALGFATGACGSDGATATTDADDPGGAASPAPAVAAFLDDVLLAAPLGRVEPVELAGGSAEAMFGPASRDAPSWSLRASSGVQGQGELCLDVAVGAGADVSHNLMCGQPTEIPAMSLGVSGTLASDDVYLSGITRADVARVAIGVEGRVVVVETISHPAFPGVGFFVTGVAKGDVVSSATGLSGTGQPVVEVPAPFLPDTNGPPS